MFDRSAIMSKAWADYRRDEFRGWGVRPGEPFNRKRFAYCLRIVWAVAKERAARAAAEPVPAPVAKPCTNPVRAAEIRADLFDMEMGNFINWTRHASLGAELARLHV
ncbi:hypothetical protein NIM87_05950 [Devosia sp. XJ19-1]|uniref:Uncharacterized protein n=1 Tax=Devosia ureilytica TaxID=2952754 RepID=A0A9Q4FRU8_9HYPH|nr:hypothetical protein [Devosia ureilytica]MCP8883035.1 hypothetical protein [Devosia ureilytica]MCP8886597.1 hypothetical protein [Devosia ureilytica]